MSHRDEQGGIVRWYGTGVDIEERKQAEQRTHAENLVLGKKSIKPRCSRRSSGLRALTSDACLTSPRWRRRIQQYSSR